MRKIVLIACASQKLASKAKARDLYTSTLFKKSLAYAQRLQPDSILILSAKHALLDLETEIEPYNLTLNNMSASEIRSWAERVVKQLSERSDLQRDHFIFLAGMKYRKYLVPHLHSWQVPLEGMRIGEQLHFLGG